MGPRLRHLTHQYSVGRLPSILRTLSRVQVSHKYSIPRALVCTVQVTGAGSAVVPHQLHDTAVCRSSRAPTQTSV
jgi:hypothetical protein